MQAKWLLSITAITITTTIQEGMDSIPSKELFILYSYQIQIE